MNSQFSAIGSMIERKIMILYHAIHREPGHALNMLHGRKLCDAYVVERLKANATSEEALKEIDRTFIAMLPFATFKKMVYFMEGCDPETAISKMGELYNLKPSEARLALCLLQICTKRRILVIPEEVEVVILD